MALSIPLSSPAPSCPLRRHVWAFRFSRLCLPRSKLSPHHLSPRIATHVHVVLLAGLRAPPHLYEPYFLYPHSSTHSLLHLLLSPTFLDLLRHPGPLNLCPPNLVLPPRLLSPPSHLPAFPTFLMSVIPHHSRCEFVLPVSPYSWPNPLGPFSHTPLCTPFAFPLCLPFPVPPISPRCPLLAMSPFAPRQPLRPHLVLGSRRHLIPSPHAILTALPTLLTSSSVHTCVDLPSRNNPVRSSRVR